MVHGFDSISITQLYDLLSFSRKFPSLCCSPNLDLSSFDFDKLFSFNFCAFAAC